MDEKYNKRIEELQDRVDALIEYPPHLDEILSYDMNDVEYRNYTT